MRYKINTEFSFKDLRINKRTEDQPKAGPSRKPTEEEIAYQRLLEINPKLERLVEELDLVSLKTGLPVNIVNPVNIK